MKVCLQFKFLEKPVDFTAITRYDKDTEREAEQTCSENAFTKTNAAQPS